MKESTEKLVIIYWILAIIASFCIGWGLGTSIQSQKNESKLVEKVVEKVYTEKEELSEWSILQLAIMKTESEFDPGAIGASQDLGVFQQTPIFIEEVNRILRLKGEKKEYTHLDAFDVQKSIEMFNIVQDYHNREHSISKTFTVQNPGGASIGYGKRVYDNIRFIKRLEEARKEVLKYEALKSLVEEPTQTAGE